MNKITIIGSPCAGKSTLARNLHAILNIRVIYLDRVFWEPGWKKRPRETRIDILQKIMQEQQWIIEGTYLEVSEPRLEASDTIIFLDTSAFLCFWRILKRYTGDGRRGHEIHEGCYDRLNLFRILKVLVFPFKGKKELKLNLDLYQSKSKNIIRLRSKKDIEGFFIKLDPQYNMKKNFLQSPSTQRSRELAPLRH